MRRDKRLALLMNVLLGTEHPGNTRPRISPDDFAGYAGSSVTSFHRDIADLRRMGADIVSAGHCYILINPDQVEHNAQAYCDSVRCIEETETENGLLCEAERSQRALI